MTLEAAMSYADSSSAHLKPVHMPKSAGLSFKPLLAVPVIVAVLTLTLATIMVLLLKPPAVGVDIVMPVASDNVHGAQLAQQIASEGSTPDNMLSGNITIAPMRVLPPFAPTCFVMHEERDNVGCPVINCSLDATCTTLNKTCCAYINLQMMLFFDQFLASKGLEGEYLLVFGSALGALRNRTVLPHTSDVDFGFSPKVARLLERNETKRELWRHGYALWADTTVWRMCPHEHHPSQDFQQLMLPLADMNHYQHAAVKDAYAGTCWLDGFLIWPVSSLTSNCSTPDPDLDLDHVLGASDGEGSRDGSTWKHLAAQIRQQEDQPGSKPATQGKTFCIHRSTLPVELKPFSRPAVVDGYRLPAAEDLQGHVEATYGPSWQSPDLMYHGADPETPDVDRVRAALKDLLSVTAWGDIPWHQRYKSCGMRHS